MAKKMQVGVNGITRKVKKMYVGVDGVARKVKSGYVGVNGVAKKFFSSFKPFTYAFSLYPYQGISINSYCELSSWFAGYRADGTPGMDIVCWNATHYSHCAPAARITIDFADPAALVGKTITVTYTKDFDTDVSDNELWWYYTINNGIRTGGSLNGAIEGEGLTFSHKVEAGTTNLYMEMFVGGDGTHGAHITITSIKVDGEEVLR